MSNEPQEQVQRRTESFPCAKAAEVDVRLFTGRIEVQTVDEPVARVAIAAAPADGPWLRGLAGLRGLRTGAATEVDDDLVTRAIRETKVTWSEDSGRLTVHAPSRGRSRVRVPLSVWSRCRSSRASRYGQDRPPSPFPGRSVGSRPRPGPATSRRAESKGTWRSRPAQAMFISDGLRDGFATGPALARSKRLRSTAEMPPLPPEAATSGSASSARTSSREPAAATSTSPRRHVDVSI